MKLVVFLIIFLSFNQLLIAQEISDPESVQEPGEVQTEDDESGTSSVEVTSPVSVPSAPVTGATVHGAVRNAVKGFNTLLTPPPSTAGTQMEFDFSNPSAPAATTSGRALAVVNSGKAKYMAFIKPPNVPRGRVLANNALSVLQLTVDVWYDSGAGYKLYTSENRERLGAAATQALQNTIGSMQDPLETSRAITRTATGLAVSAAPTPLGLISATGKSLNYVSILVDEVGQIQELALTNYLSGMQAEAMVAASRMRFANTEEYHSFVQEYMNAHMNIYVMGQKVFLSYTGRNLRLIAEGGAATAAFLSRVGGVATEMVSELFDHQVELGQALGEILADTFVGDPFQTGLMSAVDTRTRSFLSANGVSLSSNLGRALVSRMRVIAQESRLSNSDNVKAGLIANESRLREELEYLRSRAAPGSQ